MIDLEKLKLILQSSYQPIAQSSRRLLKVHSDGGMDGRYKPSSTGSHVSGVLLWFNYKYFFLTARHCLQKFRDELGNEIPLNYVTPGIASDHTLFYGVEAKFYSDRVDVDNTFQTKIKNLYVGGDGAGITRGLAQAGANGVKIARSIIKR